MAAQKEATRQHQMTVQLNDEEYELLEAFAAEEGINDLALAIPAMVHELVRLHDALWDKQLEQIPPALDAIAQKALDDNRAGLTEELDI